jgi:transposase
MSLLFPCYLSPLVVDEGDSRAVSCLFMSHAPTDPKSASALLSGLPDEARSRALSRFQIIRSFLEDGVPLTQIAQEQGLVLRTARRWVDRYRREGLTGLARKERNDKDRRKLAAPLRQLIEGMALRKPRMPTATIHREVSDAARKMGHEPPSYKVVRAVVGELEPALVTLAHEGSKAYSESFDLVHRHEADAPNAIWQADHTELDILVKDGDGVARRPWLTIILDDYKPGGGGLLPVAGGPVGDPDGPCAAAGDLAEAATGLARLRHPAGALFRSRQRLHIPASGAGGRRPENPPDQLHRGLPTRAGEDRALL